MLGYVSGVVFQDVRGDLKWRLIIGSPAILPLIVMAYVFVLPESPRWLLEKARKSKATNNRRYQQAFDSLHRLRGNRLLAARDTFLIYHTLEEEEKIKQHRNRFIEMFSVKRNRRALTAGVVVMYGTPSDLSQSRSLTYAQVLPTVLWCQCAGLLLEPHLSTRWL